MYTTLAPHPIPRPAPAPAPPHTYSSLACSLYTAVSVHFYRSVIVYTTLAPHPPPRPRPRPPPPYIQLTGLLPVHRGECSLLSFCYCVHIVSFPPAPPPAPPPQTYSSLTCSLYTAVSVHVYRSVIVYTSLASIHCAMGRRIDTSWWTYSAISRSSQC